MGYVRVPLKVKTKKEENKKPKKAATPQKENPSDAISGDDLPSELNEPRWSVVSFDERVAGNLTYDKAAEKLSELETQKVSGLCIITDEAAEKMGNKK